MVSRQKRAKLRYLRKWLDRYLHMTPTDDHYFQTNDPALLEVESDELEHSYIEASILEMQAVICVQDRFCPQCQQMLDTWPASEIRTRDLPYSVRRYDSISMEAAARNGCQFCACVLSYLLDSEMLDLYRRMEMRFRILREQRTSSLSIGSWIGTDTRLLKLTLPGLAYPLGDVIWIRFDTRGRTPAIRTNPDGPSPTENVLDIACAWIKACDSSHDACALRQSRYLPTRLISTSGSISRLELTESWHSPIRYATLSYCWGALDFIKTTTSNLAEFLVEIPYDRLPQTFKDAIRITQALGITHMWIDSLCIIQDSDDDWRKESSLMSEVYGNSYINIAASSATDPSEGCFMKPMFMRDALTAEISTSKQRYACDFHNIGHSYTSAVQDSHLLTRAWALQEKLLPARTIHFGDRGAFWECRSDVKLECLPGLAADAIRNLCLTWLLGDLAEATKSDVCDKWHRVISAYSKANLTFSRDKLPGLAGVAEHFGRYKRCEYLAGIWKDETFDAHLCWCNFWPRPRPIWRAPTWSWASVDGYTSFNAYKPQTTNSLSVICARTLEAHVTRVSNAEFGEVSDGWIQITCSYVVPGKIRGSQEQQKLEFSLDGSPCYPLLFRTDCTDDIDVGKDEMVFVLPLAATTLNAVELAPTAEEQDVRGLVLQQTSRALGEFRRIGFFQCGTTTFGDELVEQTVEGRRNWNQFIGLIQEQGAITAKEVCAEVIDDTEHGTGGFIITIV